MSDKKIIAILGATGAQGGGLARAILDDPNSDFAVRAITRNTESDKAKALAAKGAQVVQADVSDKDSLLKAFTGCYGVYAVTFFWEHFSPEKEMANIRNIAEAAKETNMQHVVWSTLEDTRKWIPLDDDRMPTLMEHYKVPHFDSKGSSDKHFEDLGIPTTYLLTSFYWDNFIYFGMGPRKNEDGSLTFALPLEDKALPGIAAEDIGRCAYGILKAGDKYIGERVGIAGEHLTGEEMAQGFAKALDKTVHYYAMPFDDYRALGFPGSDDLGNMMQFKCEFNDDFCSVRPVDRSRILNPKLQTYQQWIEANIDRIPIQ